MKLKHGFGILHATRPKNGSGQLYGSRDQWDKTKMESMMYTALPKMLLHKQRSYTSRSAIAKRRHKLGDFKEVHTEAKF